MEVVLSESRTPKPQVIRKADFPAQRPQHVLVVLRV
jgi:hypothetical protein